MILINFAVSKEKKPIKGEWGQTKQLYWACIVSFVAYFTMRVVSDKKSLSSRLVWVEYV